MGKMSSCEYREQEKTLPGTWSWESNPFSNSPFAMLSGGGAAWGQKGLDSPERPKEPGEGGCMRAMGVTPARWAGVSVDPHPSTDTGGFLPSVPSADLWDSAATTMTLPPPF